LHPFVDAFEIMPLLTVELNQSRDDLERLVLGIGMAQFFGALDVETGGATKDDVEAAIDADHPDILAGGFRAIAGAAGHGHFDLGRGPTAPHEFFDANAEPGGILGAEAAPVRADAGFDRAQ